MGGSNSCFRLFPPTERVTIERVRSLGGNLPVDQPSAPREANAAIRQTEAGWVALLRAGGKARQSAISQLYAHYGREFKGYFRRHGVRDPFPEDLLQETFVKILRSIETWSGAGSLEAWMWAIARNTLMSHFRSIARADASVALHEQDPESSDESLESLPASADPAGSNPAVADCVRRGLEGFAAAFAEYAHVLERMVVDGWSYDEVAAYRQCSQGAAREYLSQCRKRVWQHIGHCYGATS